MKSTGEAIKFVWVAMINANADGLFISGTY
jgi:hypothetical protein